MAENRWWTLHVSIFDLSKLMTRILHCFFVLLVIGLPVCLAEDADSFRTWTSSNGTTLDAEFIRLSGSMVVLKNRSGKQLSIGLANISKADRGYVKTAVSSNAKNAAQRRSLALQKTQASKTPPADVADVVEGEFMSQAERDVLDATNHARRFPKAYAEIVRKYRAKYLGEKNFKTNHGILTTQEGLTAVDEAIAFLEAQQALQPLKASKGLSDAARDHAKDIGKAGIVGHEGSDGSQPVERVNRHGKWRSSTGENIQFGNGDGREIVMQLIIDDGVPNRGHRTNIFKKDYNVAGVAIAPHSKYGSCCVIEYAGGFSR